MANTWFYVYNQQQIGPVSEEEMIKLFREGFLGPATMVGQAGGNWQPASQSALSHIFYDSQTGYAQPVKAAEASPPPAPEWYYARGQRQLGPLPEVNIRHLIQQGQIGPDVFVGQAGGSWITVRDSVLASSLPAVKSQPSSAEARPSIDSSFIYKPNPPKSFSERQAATFGGYSPPPSPYGQAAAALLTEERKNISDIYAWLMTLLPVLSFLARAWQTFFRPEMAVGDSMVYRVGGGIIAATIFLVFMDKGLISRAGTRSPSFFLFLVPFAYLFRRAQYLGKTVLPAALWLMGAAGFIGWPWLVDMLRSYGLIGP